MNFNINLAKYDRVLPPEDFLAKQEDQDVVDATEKKKKLTRGQVLRGLGVLVSSFIVTFSVLYTFLTWPLVPTKGEYLIQQITGKNDQVQAQVIDVLDTSDPKQDTDRDGFTDQQELAAGYDPRNAKPEKLDSDGDGIKDEVEEQFYGTDSFKADSDSDGYNDLEEIVNGFSPLRPADYKQWVDARTSAVIRIPKINVMAPVVWTKNPDDIENDLSDGVIHYPGSDVPGGDNNLIITGHSSFWSWSNTKYGTIFALIDKLDPGDQVYVDYTGTRYVYEMQYSEETDPYDVKNFQSTNEHRLTMMTCYPPGSTARRYYVIAGLVAEIPLSQIEDSI